MGFTHRKAMIIIILYLLFSAVNILLIPWVNNTVILLIGDIVAWIALNLCG